MSFWLVKSEPEEYSFEDLLRDGKTAWDGVRNYAARNHLRAMNTGDLVLFYHSVKQKSVVGIARVVRTHYPDPTAQKGDWSAVDLAPVMPLKKPVSLAQIKAEPSLADIPLVRIGRLSVMPLPEAAFFTILKLGETPTDNL
ncbi:MAG: EVE domain-containing protein [Bacteroidetes bacterium]|nr:MAG: EVE domain-containing protein [Bacteroidota bacterium]